jgi:Flp pilus assembly protein TadG
MRNLLRRLRRDEKGASVIEFALFAPVLGLMVMGVSDLAMGYSTKLKIEGAIYRSLERVAVGSTAGPQVVQNDYSFLQTEAATAAGVPTSQVSVDQWLECNRVRQTDFAGACPDGQDTARYVKVTINTSYTPRFSYGPLVRNTNGVVPIEANASLRVQ